MRSVQNKVWAGVAWTLLCAVSRARAIDTMSIYEPYMSAILAVGGLLLGGIVVVLVMCSCWNASTLRLQPRERRMWETTPRSAEDAAVLEKLNEAADAARKRRPKKATYEKGQCASTTSSNDGDGVSAGAKGGKQRNTRSPGADATSPGSRSNGANPYARTEDDVVAFNNSLPGKPAYF